MSSILSFSKNFLPRLLCALARIYSNESGGKDVEETNSSSTSTDQWLLSPLHHRKSLTSMIQTASSLTRRVGKESVALAVLLSSYFSLLSSNHPSFCFLSSSIGIVISFASLSRTARTRDARIILRKFSNFVSQLSIIHFQQCSSLIHG